MKAINGWTKERMIARVREKVPSRGCVDRYGRCVYRDAKGGACAAGAFMPDDHPAVNGIGKIVNLVPRMEKWMPLRLIGMQLLQDSHDLAWHSGGLDVTEVVVQWIEENVE